MLALDTRLHSTMQGQKMGVSSSVPHRHDYVKLAAPEPEVLLILGEESKRNGTHKMTQRQIDQEIKAYRAQKKKR